MTITANMEFHEVANLFPLITGQEFDDLVKDIRDNGLQQPIWTYQDKIIDGRNRYRACLNAGIEPRYQEWDGKGSLVAFTISLNVKRRHLTSSQLSVIALEVEKQLAEEANKRQLISLKQNNRNSTESENGNDYSSVGQKNDQRRSAHEAANLLGTNHDYVSAAKKIEKDAPELLEHVMNGTLTTPDAKAIASLPKERREKVLKKAVEKKKEEGKRVSRAVKEAVAEEQIDHIREQTASQAQATILPHTLQLIHGDFRSAAHDIEDNSVDLLFTDPPYHEDHLQLWSDLSCFAARILKPGGILLAYSGQVFLPEVLNRLSGHLAYCWLFGIQHTGGHIQIWMHNVWNDWKPIVMFSKGKPAEHDWLMDLYRGDKGDKTAHEWSQGEKEAAYFIEKLTKPGQLVVDPMCGSGTILRAAHSLQRKSFGIEVDKDRYNIALASMKDLVKA